MRLLNHRLTAGRSAVACLAGLCLVAACTGSGSESGSDKPQALSKAPVWQNIPVAELPADFVNFYPSSMSSSSRALFAASGYLPTTSLDVPQKVFASRDGRRWRDHTPEEMSTAATVQSLASYGSTTWLLGGQGVSPARTALWSTDNDGSSWKGPMLLPRSPDTEIPVAVAAGKQGALVVTKVTPGSGKPDEQQASLRVWLVKKAGRPAKLFETPCGGHEGSEASAEILVADDASHLLTNCTTGDFRPADQLFTSPDGHGWKKEPLPDNGNEFDHLARNDDTMVLAGGQADDDVEHTTEPHTWYRQGSNGWHTGAPLDAGRLPDAGVVPRKDQKMLAITAAGSGFVAIGSARSADNSAVGALWFSADGKKWSKQATRANGFDKLRALTALTAWKKEVVVLASRRSWETSDPAHARIWIGDLAPGSPSPSPSATRGPLAQFVGTWTWSGASITIKADGTFTYRYLTMVQCSEHAPPCDQGAKMGGKASGTLHQGRTADEAAGTVVDALPNDPAGSSITISREPYMAINITINKRAYGLFCEPDVNRCAGHVGGE
ncbi:hypothetical protein G3I62_27490 [Streptomyces sp. SID14446]|uniref:hypothetical protein n=1 Tax=Streptomyces sp. SID14446 TaxID=2706072 RepID=UPI0013BD0CDF|nr:hypothetical protein [Streptomyces sp. SID14446]NEB32791.1 hypothetical protein [Streptomyces sp. SID14446]